MKPTKQIHQPIIDLCKNNCAKSQMQLYNLYCKGMILVANRFVKAFKNIKNYKNEVAFGAWLKRIVINQSIDYLKKNKLELVSINEEVYKKEDEDDNWNVNSEISVDVIVETINSLKEKYRLVLTLYLLEGYDHQEISEILNITENTSRTHLLRGKKIVKEQLKNMSYAERY